MRRFGPQVKFAAPVVAALVLVACGGGGGGGGGSGPPPVPTVSLTASATDVAKGGSTSLSWSSTNATSGSSSGDWNGTLATSGSQTAVVSQTSVYNLSCQGPGGSASTGVVVIAWVAPRVAFSGDTEIVMNNSATIGWSAESGKSCQWRDTPGVFPANGTTYTPNLLVDTTLFITCSNAFFSTTASVTIHVLATYTLAITVKYQAPGGPVPNSLLQLVPNWTSPLESPVPFVSVELQDHAGNVVRQAFADSHGVATLTNVDATVDYIPVIRSQAQDPSRSLDLAVLDNTDPVDTTQPTFRARYRPYSESGVEYRHNKFVSQSLSVTAPDGWDSTTNNLDDSRRIAAPFALLANAVAEADLVTAATTGSSSSWRPLSILWSVHNKGGLSSSPNNYDLGLVAGSGGFYTPGHGGIDSSGVASGAAAAEDFIFLSGDPSFEAMDIYPTAMTHEMGHFTQRLFSTLDSPGGGHARGDLEDQTLSWTEGSASAISALMMNTPLQNRTVAVSGTIVVSTYDITTDRYNASVPGRASVGWYSEDTVTRLLWTLYDPAGSIGLTPTQVLAPMFSSTWRAAAWPNTMWGYLAMLKQFSSSRASAVDSAANALNITASNNDEWGSMESHPANRSSSDVLPPHPVVHVSAAPVYVCSAGRPNEYNKAGNVRYLRLALDGNTRTLTVRGPTGSVPILDRFYFQPGNSTVSQTGTFPAGDQVVSIGDCAVARSPNASDTAACNEPSPPEEVCWAVTLQ